MKLKALFFFLFFLAALGLKAQVPGFFIAGNQKKVELPFLASNSLILLPVSINGHPPVYFLLDTGVKANLLFSKAMGDDETATLKKLKESRAFIDKSIASHYGRIFNTSGDSVIAEFSSPVDAVTAAIEFQKLLKQRNSVNRVENQAHFRVGINLGDVIVQGNDLMGEGINIAARLESIGIPGGICISNNVHSEVRKRFDSVGFFSRGLQSLKNIEDPVEVFDISIDKSPIKYEAPKPSPASTSPSAPQDSSAAPEVTKEIKGLMMQSLQGDLAACYQLGYIYENGEGVAVNEAEAIRWYTENLAGA